MNEKIAIRKHLHRLTRLALYTKGNTHQLVPTNYYTTRDATMKKTFGRQKVVGAPLLALLGGILLLMMSSSNGKVEAFVPSSSSSSSSLSLERSVSKTTANQHLYRRSFVIHNRSTLPPSRTVLRRNNIMATVSSKSSFRLHAVMDIVGVSPEPIHTAFAYATFGPQPFWLLLIFLPKADITKQVMGKMGASSSSLFLFLLFVCNDVDTKMIQMCDDEKKS
jgi:hypothetical protein